MTKKTLALITALLALLCSVCLAGCTSTESVSITANSKIDVDTQSSIVQLIKSFSAAYRNHDLLLYNQCVSDKLEYGDNSDNKNERTKNYFDTVSDCTLEMIDFENAEILDESAYKIPIVYTITYNESFKEDSELKKGKNRLSSLLTIKQTSGGYYLIDDIENV